MSRFREIQIRGEQHVGSDTPRAAPLLLRPGAFAPPGAGRASACCLSIFGAGQWVNGHGWGAWRAARRLAWSGPSCCTQWFRDAIGESEGGLYSDRIDVSFRWSMSWFIFSEVMFFGAFFGALVLGPRCTRCRASAASRTRCCGPTSRRVWPSVGGRHHRRRRPASSSRSRRWARGRSRRSTPRCC